MSDEIFEAKKKKFLELRGRGELKDQYPKTHTASDCMALPEGTVDVSMAGRVVGMRTMGKILFAHLFDITGKIQICVRKDPEATTSDFFELFKESVAIGDFVGVKGEMFVTKTGETTIRASSFQILNKCFRTLPEKYQGIADIETKYRQRYLDLVTDDESRNVFLKRIATIRAMRNFLENEGFLEVETPVLQTLQSGAMARPFNTHHNALDIPLVLRIAPETYLKRCIGGGFDKVYEFARCFRNEGISATHLQDFTMLEFYAAYWNADRMQGYISKLLKHVIENVFGTNEVEIEGHKVRFDETLPVYD